MLLVAENWIATPEIERDVRLLRRSNEVIEIIGSWLQSVNFETVVLSVGKVILKLPPVLRPKSVAFEVASVLEAQEG